MFDDILEVILIVVLINYVFGGEVIFFDLMVGYYFMFSVIGFGDVIMSFYVNFDNGVVLNGGFEVVVLDVDVDNGVIYGIDVVILLFIVVDFVMFNLVLFLLVVVLICFDFSIDFVGVLSGEGLFIVFVLSNVVFQVLFDSNDDWNMFNDIFVGMFEVVFFYYVSSGVNVCFLDFFDGMMVSILVEGVILEVDFFNLDVFQIVGGSSIVIVVLVDIQGVNGVVYVIDMVLLF